MYGILIFLFVLVAVLMTVSILMQSAKGGGLAASFGGMGGGGVFGPRGAANFLQKATTVLATLYLLLCLMIGLIGRPTAGQSRSVVQQELQKQRQQTQSQPASLPVAPIQTGEPSPQQQTPAENPPK
ncbi:preprotein translocase subunit SecG [candidate division KSB1 bacterium 4484_188]|nr:MAG: preprotein translocase subunit SecG [candidate division KSB1 bacterium 4484_188]HFE64494.1 preprotein translocase subunit SecG [Caldithrix sp.]